MSLAPGSRLGPYEVTALLGEGGMGQVYRATDTSLKRQVAIKVLPASVAADADLANTPSPWHGAWGPQGVLYVARGTIGHVSTDGTELPAPFTVDAAQGVSGLFHPILLPDGRRFLVRVISADGRGTTQLVSLDGGTRITVGDAAFGAVIPAATPDGRMYLLLHDDQALMAQPFDPATGRVSGESLTLVANIGLVASPVPRAAAGVSPAGTLAYQAGFQNSQDNLAWYDRSGKLIERLSDQNSGSSPMISPDGQRVAIVRTTSSVNDDLWILDLARGSSTRFTFDEGNDLDPIWSPTGAQIAFRSFRNATWAILVKDSGGGGDEQPLVTRTSGPPFFGLTSWTPDGRQVLVQQRGGLFLQSVTNPSEGVQVGSRNGGSSNGRVSPDGRFIAFVSNESGEDEVYVQPMPPKTGQWKVSVNGGTSPRWRRDGKELFYVSANYELMAVEVVLGEAFKQEVTRTLFAIEGRQSFAQYDVSADGQRFLIRVLAGDDNAPITVVRNWWVGLGK